MVTNLTIDDRLIKEAKIIGKHRTISETITEALKEYIARRRQMEIIELFGTIDYEPGFDYKEQRKRS